MKGYITKYALTEGIIETELEVCTTVGEGSMTLAPKLGYCIYFHGEGREWHRTKESAIKQANLMVGRKLTSLRKKVAELEALKFS